MKREAQEEKMKMKDYWYIFELPEAEQKDFP